MIKLANTTNFEGFELKYYKVTLNHEGNSGVPTFYGVLVEQYLNGNIVERVYGESFTTDEADINRLINVLAGEMPTLPSTLNEVLHEWKHPEFYFDLVLA